LEERVITIGFAIFCMTCEQPIRPAADDDATGDVHFCTGCGKSVNVACGITVFANHKEDLRWVGQQIKKNMSLVQEILIRKFRPRDAEE